MGLSDLRECLVFTGLIAAFRYAPLAMTDETLFLIGAGAV